jgi:hypothetical protein
MRCPHCAGEIPAGSRFCGICGRGITPAVGGGGRAAAEARPSSPSQVSPVESVSLFELPDSRAGRRARMALVLVLDAILAGAGLVMMLAYFESRSEGREPAPAASGASLPRAGQEGGEAGGVEPSAAPEPGGEAAVPEPPRPAPRKPLAPADKGKTAPRSKKAGARSEVGGAAAPSGDNLAAAEPEWVPVAEVQPSRRERDGDERIADQLGAVVARHQAELEDCYRRFGNSGGPDAPLEGSITIRFTLMPEGRAANVSPAGNTTGSAALADCVADRIGAWRFPDSPSSPVVLEWPFQFRPPARAEAGER